MKSRDFCFWLQGFFELRDKYALATGNAGGSGAYIGGGGGGCAGGGGVGGAGVYTPALSTEQVEMIRAHLALVFKHEIDPSMGNAAHQAELDGIHTAPNKTPFNRPPGMRC